jgi:GNAT superfamily N-acetyltransferase
VSVPRGDSCDPLPRAIVRRARAEDVPALAALLAELFSLEPDFAVERARQERGLRALLERETACVVVAEAGGRVVGMASAQAVVSTAEGGEAALVEDVVVTEAERGRGLGSALLPALEQWCRERGIERLQLLADRENAPALAFYERRGWARTRLVALRKQIY